MRSYPSAEDDPLSSSSQAITEVYVWGNNRFGQLGLGEKYKGQVLELPKFCSFNLTISQISCGSDFTVFITLKGHIYSMGSNKKGALGLGEEGSNVSATSSPLLVESLCSQMACGVSCGANHTMVLVEDGRAYSWGSGETGQTSLGNYETTNVPTEIKTADQGNGTLPFFKQVSCGASNSGLITSEGHVYLCGDNQHGQLANGKTGKENKLVRCQFFAEKIKYVTIGDSHVLFLTEDGEIYGCGSNTLGELGIGNKRSAKVPMKIKELENEKIQKVSAGQFSACITINGELYVWGTGTFGENLIPKKIETEDTQFTEISLNGTNIAVLDSNGFVWTSGPNSSGQLGIGDFQSSNSLNIVSALQSRQCHQIKTGNAFMVALGNKPKQDDLVTIVKKQENPKTPLDRSFKGDSKPPVPQNHSGSKRVAKNPKKSLKELGPETNGNHKFSHEGRNSAGLFDDSFNFKSFSSGRQTPEGLLGKEETGLFTSVDRQRRQLLSPKALEGLQHENRHLIEHIKKMESIIRELEEGPRGNKALIRKNIEYEKIIELLTHERNALAEEKDKNQYLKSVIESLEEQKICLQSENQKITRDKHTKDMDIGRLNGELESYLRKTDSLRSERNELERQIEELEQFRGLHHQLEASCSVYIAQNEELNGKCKLLLEENAYLKKNKESLNEQLRDAHELITVLQDDAREKESKLSELYEKLEAKDLYIHEANDKNKKLVKLLDQQIEEKTEKMRSQSQKGRREVDIGSSSGKKTLDWRGARLKREEEEEEDSYRKQPRGFYVRDKETSNANQTFQGRATNHSARKLMSVLESYKDSPSKRHHAITTPQMRGESSLLSRNTMDNIYSVNSKKKLLEEKLKILNKI